MPKSNAEILNQVRDHASEEYRYRVPVADETNMKAVYQALDDFPNAKNEFINSLTNKMVKTKFYSKVFENPLKMLHGGMLEFGDSVEQIFVDMAEKKNFGEHWDDKNQTPEADLIRKKLGTVRVRYIQKNFAYKYKVTVSELQLQKAFYSRNGLHNLISQLVSSMTSGAYFDEYEDMKKILFNAVEGKDFNGNEFGQTLINTESGPQKVDVNPMKAIEIPNFETNPAGLIEVVRELADTFVFPSTEYNMAGVKTWCNKEELIYYTNPKISAKLDVNVLAHAFNVGHTDIKTRVVKLDSLPVGKEGSAIPEGKKCLGILAEKAFIQFFDEFMTMKQFENGDELTINKFLHKQGMAAQCLFANTVVLYG